MSAAAETPVVDAEKLAAAEKFKNEANELFKSMS